MAKHCVIFVLLVLVLVPSCRATVYTVGDSAGWDISADLSDWPTNKSFQIGDTLLFQYSQYHSVNQVNKEGYESCNATNAILTGHDGNTSVPLLTPGDMYFICGALSHCLGGMKLQVTVGRTSQASAPAPQSPVLYPQSPPTTTTPPLIGGPSTTKNDNHPTTHVSSGSNYPFAARDSKLLAWLCSIGSTLLWVLVNG